MQTERRGPDPKFIQSTFSNIADNYDRANSAITFGMVHGWRKKMIEVSGAKLGSKVLDCATGTGDLAIEFKKVVGPSGVVVGSDFCHEMLAKAPIKAQRENLDIVFEWADATDLPYEDSRFDIVSIGYGIRNVSDPVKALKEMTRVCKAGGKVIILETGDSRNPILQPFINLYFKWIVPRIGGLVGGNREAYEYLNQSSNQFPSKEEFVSLMNQVPGLTQVQYLSLMGGASFIYTGIKSH
ncbi:MAG: bifunctional demethylmenaquinone methyltransferase/2-methoxy-6-polyprenyl-1,4-benzoquinol methylase UbiE [Bdellovibrionales bacterium]